jgi:hypothetical protein
VAHGGAAGSPEGDYTAEWQAFTKSRRWFVDDRLLQWKQMVAQEDVDHTLPTCEVKFGTSLVAAMGEPPEGLSLEAETYVR